MKKFWKWMDQYFEETLLMFFLVAMSIVMMLQVIMRKMGLSLPWPEEFCRYCFVVSGFLSIGYCIRRDKMLKVDILLGLFPDVIKKVLEIASKVVTLWFFSYLLYYGYFAALNSYQGGMVSPAMKIPMWILYGSVVVGCLIGVIRQIQDFYCFFTKRGRYSRGKGDTKYELCDSGDGRRFEYNADFSDLFVYAVGRADDQRWHL